MILKLQHKRLVDMLLTYRFNYKFLSVVTQLTKVRYTLSMLQIYFKYNSTLTKVRYTFSILQIYWKYTFKVFLKDTSSILEVYFQYTSCYLKDTLSIL